MGSRFGPNYTCSFVGHTEEIFQQYRGKTPDLYKRYIDDIVGALRRAPKRSWKTSPPS